MEYKKVINGYNIYSEISKTSEGTKREQNLRNIIITYLCDGKYFAESSYKNVPEEKVEKIKEKMFDNTLYNLNVEFQCQAIALPTLIFQIEDIIYNG